MTIDPPVEDASISPYLGYEKRQPGESSYVDLRGENVKAREGYAKAREVLGEAAKELADFHTAFEEKVRGLVESSANPDLSAAWRRLSEAYRDPDRVNAAPYEAPTLQLQAGRRQRWRHPTRRSYGAAVVDGAKRTLSANTTAVGYDTERIAAAAKDTRAVLRAAEQELAAALYGRNEANAHRHEFADVDRPIRHHVNAVRAVPDQAPLLRSYALLLDRYKEVRVERGRAMRDLQAEKNDDALRLDPRWTELRKEVRNDRFTLEPPPTRGDQEPDPVATVERAKRALAREIGKVIRQTRDAAELTERSRRSRGGDPLEAKSETAAEAAARPTGAVATDAPRRSTAARPSETPTRRSTRAVIQPASRRGFPSGGDRPTHRR
ncbi:hypothetical protein LG943_24740 [Streptomonospora sp. S1-112]|uniref:Uncharacterized protein n=1 Tax=Streptomonospora mangrovi TaxID=2883123 RepID=A0A9X3NT34_9ACTN|nr:hypothetical protein [Streptomonospora mangrovi]MDA0567504.1 hypothetical protein [Streptomonospora mangrovi]